MSWTLPLSWGEDSRPATFSTRLAGPPGVFKGFPDPQLCQKQSISASGFFGGTPAGTEAAGGPSWGDGGQLGHVAGPALGRPAAPLQQRHLALRGARLILSGVPSPLCGIEMGRDGLQARPYLNLCRKKCENTNYHTGISCPAGPDAGGRHFRGTAEVPPHPGFAVSPNGFLSALTPHPHPSSTSPANPDHFRKILKNHNNSVWALWRFGFRPISTNLGKT